MKPALSLNWFFNSLTLSLGWFFNSLTLWNWLKSLWNMKWKWSLPQHTFKDIWTEILTHSFAGLTDHVSYLSCTLEIRDTSTKFIIILVDGRKSSLHPTITQVHVHVTNIPTNYAMQWQKIINQSPNFHIKTLSSNPNHRQARERATSTLYWG